MSRIGVVDVGTNSVRLLVADGPDVREVERSLEITRLGQGVDRDRALGAEPMRRTAAAIARYATRARELGAGSIRIIATSAVRDASNGADFLASVASDTGIAPELLPGAREAELGFRGATIALPEPGPYLVVDIGGGSTELVVGSETAERFVSLDIGSVRLTERHITHDPPAEAEQAAVRADAAAHIAHAAEALDAAGSRMVGLAGTVTTMAAIALGLEGYDRDAIHHSRLERGTVASIRGRLAEMTSPERRELPAMPPGREDVIVAGALILEEVMDRFGFASFVVSETDILDGAALEGLGQAAKGVSR